jgi:uncharacterized protein (DUF58 family)
MRDLIRKVRRLEIKTRRLVENTFAGEYHSAFKGQGLEFDEVRPYQYGDDIRSIDWNVTAKTGEAYVKLFREEREQTLFVLFDISGSENFGTEQQNKLLVGTELAAILAFSAMKNSDKIGMATFTDRVERFFSPAKGRKHVLAIIRSLLQHKAQSRRTNIRVAVDFIRKTLQKHSVVLVISDFLDENYAQSLVKLSNQHEVILIRLFNPNEVMKHGTGIIPFFDLESGRLVWMNSSSAQLRSQVGQAFDKIERDLVDLCKRHRMDYVALSTDGDYVQALEKFFRKRNSRRKSA